MGRDEWYRNTTWDAEIEAEFLRRLRRARDKSQCLRIQASCLAENYPTVALSLLDQYFALGDHFDAAQGHVERARVLMTLGSVERALSSYEAALERERQFPSVKTQAYLDFACIVVEAEIEGLYSRAVEVIDTHRDRPMFPVDRYRAHGARALLLQHFGKMQEARSEAGLAMDAARETQSGFRYHQQLGLVPGTESAFAKRIASLGG